MDLEEFKYGGTNITALRLVDPDGQEVKRAVKDWNKKGDVILVSCAINPRFVSNREFLV